MVAAHTRVESRRAAQPQPAQPRSAAPVVGPIRGHAPVERDHHVDGLAVGFKLGPMPALDFLEMKMSKIRPEKVKA